jgi:hypothetical protein
VPATAYTTAVAEKEKKEEEDEARTLSIQYTSALHKQRLQMGLIKVSSMNSPLI